MLTLASFVGKDFTFEALSAIADVEEDELLELMEKMLKAGLVKERVIRGEGVYSFSDIIVRDVIYEEVSFSRRKRLHSVVGTALEKVYSKNIDEHLGELALHFLEGGNKDKALDYFLKAGEKAAKVYANREAASYFQSALNLLEEKEGELPERGRVLETLGDLKTLVGEHVACINYWNEALLLWKQLEEKEKVAGLHRKMAKVLWSKIGDTEKAKGHHNKALKILETEPENVELASVYQDIANRVAMGLTGTMTEALSWAEKALELAKKLNDSEVIAKSYASVGIILGWLGDIKKTCEYTEKALKIALDNGYIETTLLAYNNLAASLPAEENERSLEYAEKGLELAKKAGDIFWRPWIGTHLANKCIGMGNMNKAMSLAEESIALDRKAGNLTHLPHSLRTLGFAYQILGEWDKSEQYYKESSSTSQRLDNFQMTGGSYMYLGGFHLDKGEYAKAREFFEKAYEVVDRHGAKWPKMWISTWLIRANIELGEIEKAKNLIDNLHKFTHEVKDKLLIAIVDALRAKLFRAQKKWKQSTEYFEKSLHEHEALNARRWDVYTFAKDVLYEYARVYLERDKKGDREKALNLLNQALEIFQKLGAKKEIEKIMAKKKLLTA